MKPLTGFERLSGPVSMPFVGAYLGEEGVGEGTGGVYGRILVHGQ